ncbi:hypothetical protein [Agromyces subbeticus]|uniref:hypothetical protein n=1 Tax=Agromyces subbeticus TaxID=293890 RepID=UPI0003B55358|nr:hypothetical protein [Agromyces subbeticus]
MVTNELDAPTQEATSDGGRQRIVHVWLSGQSDNVGDSMLRRVYADRLRVLGRLSAWVGAPESGYAAGLRLGSDEVASSYAKWCAEFARTAATGNGVFAFNAGEFVPTRRYVAGVAALLPLILLLKLRGGHIVWLGAGVRRTRPGFTWPFSLLARWSDLLLWRDATSVRLMGRGGTMPDWAFASRGRSPEESTATRDLLTVSLRGDREPPGDRWVEAVRSLAERLDLAVVVVVQVARDQSAAEVLATRLGSPLHSWATENHWEQELAVRALYRRSRLVLSDRLHALVMGMTESAVPLGWCESAGDKITRHFDVIGASWVSTGSVDPAKLVDRLDASRLLELEEATRSALSTAQHEIEGVSVRMSRLTGTRT